MGQVKDAVIDARSSSLELKTLGQQFETWNLAYLICNFHPTRIWRTGGVRRRRQGHRGHLVIEGWPRTCHYTRPPLWRPRPDADGLCIAVASFLPFSPIAVFMEAL